MPLFQAVPVAGTTAVGNGTGCGNTAVTMNTGYGNVFTAETGYGNTATAGCGGYDAYYARQYGLYPYNTGNTGCGCGN